MLKIENLVAAHEKIIRWNERQPMIQVIGL
jgi:hypothetical protein